MCLILFSWKAHKDYPLILAANRDEFYQRPTQAAQFWKDQPTVLAGRDLEAGGTWIGVNKTGRFTAITNYRDPSRVIANAPSRGDLTKIFLTGSMSPKAYLESIHPDSEKYNGFNLLVGDVNALYYYSNIQQEIVEVEAGIHGLSNAFLDTDWVKVQKGKEHLTTITQNNMPQVDQLTEMLLDSTKAADEDLPQTGVSYEWEKAISSMFIETEKYGTSLSTVILLDRYGKITFVEKSHSQSGKPAYQNKFEVKSSSILS